VPPQNRTIPIATNTTVETPGDIQGYPGVLLKSASTLTLSMHRVPDLRDRLGLTPPG